MKLPEKQSLIQFVKFGIVGVSNTGISLLIYYIFIWIDPEYYLLGNIVGWIVSVANAFFWNNSFVFQKAAENARSLLKRAGKTYLSYGATFLLSTVLLYVEVDVLNWSEIICPILNLLVTIPLNFVFNKFWTFR